MFALVFLELLITFVWLRLFILLFRGFLVKDLLSFVCGSTVRSSSLIRTAFLIYRSRE